MKCERNVLKKCDILHDRFVIEDIVGQGSFGLSYLAWDMLEKIYVIIKECAPYGQSYREEGTKNILFLNDTFRKIQLELFRNEASILKELSDLPEIVSFMNFFFANNTCYIVMDYTDGITLKEMLDKSKEKSFDECRIIFVPAIECMKVMHRRGIIHRDICPENIIISPKLKLTFIDFGSAINLHWNNSRNIKLSTYRKGFSPLEQYGTEYNFGTWSDVYSICATIYYCMTKTLPINAVDRKQYYDEWMDKISERRLKEIVENGMALQVKDRWKMTDDILKVLR